MAMNPRDAANAKGCIESVISFTKTKLPPHVPEITIRFIHSVENRKLPTAPAPKPTSTAHGRRSMGKAVERSNTIDWHYQFYSGTMAGFRELVARSP
jgi:hypothetical protein